MDVDVEEEDDEGAAPFAALELPALIALLVLSRPWPVIGVGAGAEEETRLRPVGLNGEKRAAVGNAAKEEAAECVPAMSVAAV